MKVLCISTGGTIFQSCRSGEAAMALTLTAPQLLADLDLAANCPGVAVDVEDLGVRSGADLTFETVFRARDAVLRSISAYDGFLIITGTDSLDEFAFALHLLLNAALLGASRGCAMTGAMRPADRRPRDGPANVLGALHALRTDEALMAGVVVVMNDCVHLARYACKVDSQALGAFRSLPAGPIAEIRGGRCRWHYAPCRSAALPDSFVRLAPSALRSRVVVWQVTISAVMPPDELLASLDGLVLAGAGTGSLPSSWQAALAPWAGRLPIVIASRCPQGDNADEWAYRGSVDKYERRGFVVRGGTRGPLSAGAGARAAAAAAAAAAVCARAGAVRLTN